MPSRFHEKVSRRLIGYLKAASFALRRPRQRTRPVFVMGYGRSGTTTLINAFARDLRIEVLRDNDPRIAREYLLVKDRVQPAIDGSKADTIVMKPILNSFDAVEILESYKDAKVIWMIRTYQDVIASALKQFGTQVADYLKELVLNDRGENWLATGIPAETVEVLRDLQTDELGDQDWMALVWWSVNRTVLLNRLQDNECFLLFSYEQLVQDGNNVLPKIYEFIDLPYQRRLARYFDTASLGKGADVNLSPAVRQICDSLYCRILDQKTDG